MNNLRVTYPSVDGITVTVSWIVSNQGQAVEFGNPFINLLPYLTRYTVDNYGPHSAQPTNINCRGADFSKDKNDITITGVELAARHDIRAATPPSTARKYKRFRNK